MIRNGARPTYWAIAVMHDIGTFIKANNWEYEYEVRFIIVNPSISLYTGKNISFSATYLENFIFGLRTSLEDQNTIRQLLSRE